MKEQFTTKDSGDRRTFDTGAQRDQAAGKGRYDLLVWDMIQRDAELLERGAIKYGDNNWQKGMPLRAFIDSAFRHLSQLARGDRSEDHAAAVRWNVAALEWTLDQVRRGFLPVSLAAGTVFEGWAPAKAEISGALPDPNAQRPGENAFQHRQRVNRPWNEAETRTCWGRQPDDFSQDAL